MKSFGKSPFPHKSVNLFLILVMIKDKMTDFCGNYVLQNVGRVGWQDKSMLLNSSGNSFNLRIWTSKRGFGPDYI
jgi:hypothetical protein